MCDSFVKREEAVDLFYAFRCMSIDVITCGLSFRSLRLDADREA